MDPRDHNHVYVGTVSGTLFESHDGGTKWTYLARILGREHTVLDNIVVDASRPNRLVVAGWNIEKPDGGLFISEDNGKTWKSDASLEGHSVHALAQAPSDPKIFVAGAVDGVYRSEDAGVTWTKISPQQKEFYEVESVAIDPRDAKTIYVGTWHLPWKTTDGGANWENIHKGVLDDSDVFSIIIDPHKPETVFASACSGIYKSLNGGAEFSKVQGIPATSRRTRVLQQDPKQSDAVFAGTTEGLYRTFDSGKSWTRNSNPDWIINDIYIDPQNTKHVLLATDRNGVLRSEDGGASFTSSNGGFSARQISAVAQDSHNPANLSVGVMNDREAGGVFSSTDGGMTWTQYNKGLDSADVFSLTQAPDGTLLSGTRHGIYRLNGTAWEKSGLTLALAPEEATPAPAAVAVAASKKATASRKQPPPTSASARKEARSRAGIKPVRDTPPQEATSGIFYLASSDDAVFAGTEDGLLRSADNGKTWNRVRSANGTPWRLISALGPRVVVADLKTLSLSVDKGANFHTITPPTELERIAAISVDSGGRLWIGGLAGVWYSDNDGVAWKTVHDLYVPNVSGLFFDAPGNRMLVTSNEPNTILFTVHLPDLKVSYKDAGWVLRGVRPVNDHLVGITSLDGVVLQPKMVDSAELKAASK